MRTSWGVLGAMVSAGLLSLAGRAGAAVSTITFTGVIHGDAFGSVTDGVGLFGTAGASLFGHSIVATYRLDDAMPFVIAGDGVTVEVAQGGVQFGGPASQLTGTVTIDGTTVTLGFDNYTTGSIDKRTTNGGGHPFGTSDDLIYQGTGLDTPGFTGISSRLQASLFSATNFLGDVHYDTPFAQYAALPGEGSGLFSFFAINDGSLTDVTRLAFDVTSVSADTVLPPSAAPEPASWALMLAGFGLAGVALRRPGPRATAAA